MSSSRSDRRLFLKRSAALVGSIGAGQASSGQMSGMSEKSEPPPKDVSNYGTRSHFEASERGFTSQVDHLTWSSPLQDSAGMITPSSLHFSQTHSTPLPDIDPEQHRLTIHGMVDRSLSFSLEELKRLPSVSGIYFLECNFNSSFKGHTHGKFAVQDIHGLTSCAEWTGVPLSLLLNMAGLQKGATWLVSESADLSKFSYTLPMAKALDDVMVAYCQNGEPIRPENGYPMRLFVPGWEAPYSVKWVKHIKVVDQPYMTFDESINHSMPRPDLHGKARWYNFQMPPKSVITRPSGGLKLPGRGFYEITGLAWSGGGAVRRVEVSTNGGRSWKDAKLQTPVLRMAHTRFNFDWTWDGEETVIQSRCTDERGEVQPSLTEMYRNWGLPDADHPTKPPEAMLMHVNAIQPWRVQRDGSVLNAMFS